MSLPSAAFFKDENDNIIAYGFINCGWVDDCDSVLRAIPRAYHDSKTYSSMKHGTYNGEASDEIVNRIKDKISEIEKQYEVDLYPDNWENKWKTVEAYGLVIERSDLIELGKDKTLKERIIQKLEKQERK